jgi:hypothetical protein
MPNKFHAYRINEKQTHILRALLKTRIDELERENPVATEYSDEVKELKRLEIKFI